MEKLKRKVTETIEKDVEEYAVPSRIEIREDNVFSLNGETPSGNILIRFKLMDEDGNWVKSDVDPNVKTKISDILGETFNGLTTEQLLDGIKELVNTCIRKEKELDAQESLK